MSFIELLLLSVGLSMDAFAVSVSDGMCYKNIHIKETLLIAFMFGLFQALMPVAGFFGGMFFLHYIEDFDHWVAIVLLSFLGGKMLFEGLKGKEDNCVVSNILTFKQLFLQAVATSIDALAVGISFAAIKVPIVFSVSIIGITTFLFCVPAVVIGKKTGSFLNNKAQIAGGIILIGIGLKILLSHLL